MLVYASVRLCAMKNQTCKSFDYSAAARHISYRGILRGCCAIAGSIAVRMTAVCMARINRLHRDPLKRIAVQRQIPRVELDRQEVSFRPIRHVWCQLWRELSGWTRCCKADGFYRFEIKSRLGNIVKCSHFALPCGKFDAAYGWTFKAFKTFRPFNRCAPFT